MRIGVVGSRKFSNEALVREFIQTLDREIDIVVSGHSPGGGVDIWAELEAKYLGIKTDIQYIKFSMKSEFRAAAMARNKEIVQKSDIIVAFWDEDSSGTAHTIAYAQVQRKPCKIITQNTDDPIRALQGFITLGRLHEFNLYKKQRHEDYLKQRLKAS